MPGNPEARRIADDALGLFAEVFGPFAADCYASAYGTTWRSDRGFGAGALDGRVHSVDDPAELLSRLSDETPELQRTFLPRASVAARPLVNLARGVRDRRNLLYHRARPWEAGDAWSLLDGLRQILAAFGLLAGGAATSLGVLEAEAAALVASGPGRDLEELRHSYLESVLDRTASIDLGGLNAKAASRLVRVSLDGVYVDPGLLDAGAPADGLLSPQDVLLLRRAVVVGGPGSGKSTLLRRLARLLALRTDDRVPRSTPVLLRASSVAEANSLEPGLSLRRYVTERLHERFGLLLASDLAEARVTLLLDGLDEVADDRGRAAVERLVSEFAAEYPDVPVVVTTRPTGFRLPSAWAGFSELDVQPLDDERVEAIVRAWADALREDDAAYPLEGLLAELEGSEGVRELASTPLLLTVLVLLWRRGSRLPSRRAELYEAATLTMVSDWPARRPGARVDDRRLLRLLEPLAHDMVEAGAAQVGEREVLAGWSRQLAEADGDDRAARADAEALLGVVQERTGFFVEAGHAGGERQYEFIHPSFAEYLAARELAERWDAGTLDLAGTATRLRWREAFRLLAGHLGQRGTSAATAFARALLSLEAPAEPLLRRGLRSALAVLADGLDVRPELREAVISEAVAAAVSPEAEALRVGLAARLLRLARSSGLGRAGALLLPRDDEPPDRAARRAWLRALVDPGTPGAVRDAVRRHGELAASSWSPDASAQLLGSALAGPPVSPDGLFPYTGGDVLIAGARFAPDPETVEILEAAGAPVLEPGDLARSLGLLAGPAPLWVLRAADLPEIAPADVAAIAMAPGLAWVAEALGDDYLEDWHTERAEEIRGLASDPGTSEEAALRLALEAPDRWQLHAWGAQPWVDLVAAMRQEGSELARTAASVAWAVLMVEGWPTPGTVPLPNPNGAPAWQRRAFALGVIELATRGVDCEEGDAAALQEMARYDADPTARGLARRALVIAERATSPLGLLAAPEVVLPPSATLADFGIDHTRLLAHHLLVPSAAPDERRAMARILEEVLLAAPLLPDEVAFDEGVDNPEAVEAAARLARAPRWESRGWAAMLLASLRRGEQRRVLSGLLLDESPAVRSLAVEAVTAADLESADWLLDALPGLLRLADADAASALGYRVRVGAPDGVRADLAALAELLADDPAARNGAVTFLGELLALD